MCIAVISDADRCLKLICCSFGYKTFLRAIQGQTAQLRKIDEQNPPTSRMTLSGPSRLSTSSTESAGDIDRGASLTGGSEGEATLTEQVCTCVTTSHPFVSNVCQEPIRL